MHLTKRDVKQFKALYVKYFNLELDDNTARNELSKLVTQVDIVYQPITVAQFDRYLTRYVNEDETQWANQNNRQ